MRKKDERENRIHAESARNGFISYTIVTMAFWVYNLIQTGEASWSLYAIAYGPLLIFAISMIYYRWSGLKNSLTLSNLRSD